jgi:hypothetical protein
MAYLGPRDDRKPIEVPDVQVGQMWLRVLERRARLYGLDLERSAGFGAPISREMLAEVVGWDPQHDVIDVDAEEESDEREALGRGSDD